MTVSPMSRQAARWLAWLCSGAGLAWLALMAAATAKGIEKLPMISATAALAMLVGGAFAGDKAALRCGVAIDALAGGAMLVSAVVYLLPVALHGHPATGSIGIVAGLLAAYALRRSTPDTQHESVLVALCVHAGTAGLIMGLVYTRMPALGVAVGLAIVAHKLPAGYVLGRSLQRDNRPRYPLLLPATAVGLASLPVALWQPRLDLPHGLLFGFASGLFVMAALIYLDNTRVQNNQRWLVIAAAGAGGGALVVCLAWAAGVLGYA